MVSAAHRTQIIRLIYAAVLVLFIASLFTPIISVSRNAFMHLECANPNEASGWFFLLMGPLGVFAGQFGWFANPSMLLSILPLRKSLKSVFAILAMVLAATSLTLTYIPNDIEGNMVCGFKPGLYLWLACPVLLLVAALLKPVNRSNAPARQEPSHGALS